MRPTLRSWKSGIETSSVWSRERRGHRARAEGGSTRAFAGTGGDRPRRPRRQGRARADRAGFHGDEVSSCAGWTRTPGASSTRTRSAGSIRAAQIRRPAAGISHRRAPHRCLCSPDQAAPLSRDPTVSSSVISSQRRLGALLRSRGAPPPGGRREQCRAGDRSRASRASARRADRDPTQVPRGIAVPSVEPTPLPSRPLGRRSGRGAAPPVAVAPAVPSSPRIPSPREPGHRRHGSRFDAADAEPLADARERRRESVEMQARG